MFSCGLERIAIGRQSKHVHSRTPCTPTDKQRGRQEFTLCRKLCGQLAQRAHRLGLPCECARVAHLARGTAWSANNTPQIELAEQITGRVPSVDQVLFNNSGTEAFSLALNLCRGATGRYKFLMAAGGYHGSMYDTALGSKGLPGPNHYVAPYGDTDASPTKTTL